MPFSSDELLPDAPLPGPEDVVVIGDEEAVHRDPLTGALEIQLPDGGVLIDLRPDDREDDDDGDDFYDNLAEEIDDIELQRIANDLCSAIETDDKSRSEWMETRANGIDLLGLKLEKGGAPSGSSSAPIEGMSRVRHPLLLEACLRFQANARGELLPSDGPVKVRYDGDPNAGKDELAEALERDMNHYLTVQAPEYYPDTDRMLFLVGFGGCGFKKVYNCPIRRRPVSESVNAEDIIVSDTATDLKNAARVTHRIMMRPSMLRRMQLVGAYRNVDITQPTPISNAVEDKKAEIQGTAVLPERPEDALHTIYECYCELDIRDFEHDDEDWKGIPLPYRVVIDKDSKQVLEIRRNYEEDDDLCLGKMPIVKYPFAPGLGFYDIGYVHILGNSTNALTAAWRELLDAGMFANFPGGVVVKPATKQVSNTIRVGPGEWAPIETNGMNIRDAMMAMPYKDPSATLISLASDIANASKTMAGTAEISVGEGRQDAPVGTTIALLEQAQKPMDAVHKRIHAAQAEEFQMLKALFRQDPEAFWRGNKRPALEWDPEKLLQALEDYDIVPVADPNTPSHTARVAKVMAVKQMAAANPAMYDHKKIDEWAFKLLKIDNSAQFFAPPQPQTTQPDPKLVATLMDAANKKEEIAAKLTVAQISSADKAADRDSKERIETLELAQTMAVHPESRGLVDHTIAGGVGGMPN